MRTVTTCILPARDPKEKGKNQHSSHNVVRQKFTYLVGGYMFKNIPDSFDDILCLLVALALCKKSPNKASNK